MSCSGPVSGTTPQLPPLPLLPGQAPLVRTPWTRLASFAQVAGAVLAAWTIFHVLVGIVFLGVYSEEFAPAPGLEAQARIFFIQAALVLTALSAVELHLWWIARRLRRSGGRPTRTSGGFLVVYAVLGAAGVLRWVAPWLLGGSVDL